MERKSYKGDKNFLHLTISGHHIIKNYRIYSLSKCNSKELYSLQDSLNETKFNLFFLTLFILFVIQKMNPLYIFFTLAIKRNLFGLNYKSYWTQKYFFHKICHRVFFGFPDNKETFKTINHLHLIFKYYLFKTRDTGKICLEGLKKI